MPPVLPLDAAGIADNPYFAAGFGLLGVGAGLTLARQGAARLAHLVQRRYVASLEIASKDPSYYWVLQWLARNSLRSGSHYSVQTVRLPAAAGDPAPGSATRLVPSPGVHYLRWQGCWIQVHREREKGALLDLATGAPFETLRLAVLGRSPLLFQALLEQARRDAAAQAEGKLLLYTSFAHEWRPFGAPRRRRPADSVVLDGGVAERLLADAREFLASSAWYLARGIPYRRGYLLHGPPGTGKSSFVQALAGELGYSICMLSLADGIVTDDRLSHLFNALPEKSILLLEDVDAVSLEHAPGPARLTLSGLLNALDGVGSSEERLVFMTTNHRERLAPALIRPGRIDVQQLVGLASPAQARRMFLRFYPAEDALADRFVAGLAGQPLSPASIQGHFIQHKHSAADAVSQLQQLLA